ncbi:ParB/RepB/Spo0J family partition protein [Amycolatopsis sp. NPDC098790]|uniref:ParB/RepB/Spo0J family partition protein n=1 Tax=Amycolatopsis sp. NPDC098790 TaxID=3363939 RepID=UPI00380EEEDD
MTSTMDLPTQRDTDNPTSAPDTDLPTTDLPTDDLGGAAAEDTVSDGDTTATDVEEIPLDELSDKDRAALHAQWDAEIDTIVRADPHTVLLAENVRTDNAEADEDTTANFKTHGVKTAVNGYRDYDTGTIVVTEGQRRVLNAREAGCTVPIWIKTPPPADERKATIERIVNQLIENDPALRKPVTLADTARALKQLAAFNLKPAGIARKLALGKQGKAYVENVLQAGQSELALKAAERYDLDLLQAAVIAEFDEAGDTDTAKELILTARTAPNNFAQLAERKRTERADQQRLAALTEDLTEELTAAGVTIFDTSLPDSHGDARTLDRLRPTPEDEPHTELSAEDHASCPGHGAWIETDHYDEQGNQIPVAVYGCADFLAHGHALSYAPAGRADFTPVPTSTGTSVDHESPDEEDAAGQADEVAAARAAHAAAELERQKARIIRKWVIQNNKDWDASQAPRRQWLAGLVQRGTAPKGAQLFLALQKAHGGYALRRAFERNHPLGMKLFGMPVGATLADLTDKVAKAPTAGKATLYDLVLTLCAIEDDLSRNTWRSPWGSAREYMAAIIGWGYPASDVERKVVAPETEQEVIAAQLGDLATDAISDGGTIAEGDEADGAEARNDADHTEVEDPTDEPTTGIDDVDDVSTDDQSDTATDHTDDDATGTDQEPVEHDTEAEAELISAAV